MHYITELKDLVSNKKKLFKKPNTIIDNKFSYLQNVLNKFREHY